MPNDMDLTSGDGNIDQLLAQLSELRQNKLSLYRPYPKQFAFHKAGATYRERLLRAGTQNGKTFCGSAEMAMHLTGDYPEWWPGRRWDRPIVGWVAGHTGEMTRDTVQKNLLGVVGAEGTGTIAKASLVQMAPGRSVSGLFDYVKIRHQTGGESLLRFKYYEQGNRKWMGPGVDVVWFDEEPPEDIYNEGLARTVATGGMAYLTFTPLEGMSKVVSSFLLTPTPAQCDISMTIDEAEHIPAEKRAELIASWPSYEREARAKGIPTLGSGRIFAVDEESIRLDELKVGRWWRQLGGLDFGWDHPFGAVLMLYNPDDDMLVVSRTFRAREQTPLLHAAALRSWGEWLPWAWPHDGLQHDKGSGTELADQYRTHGLNMLPDRAQFADGTYGVEAGLMEMLDRMQTGRFKVMGHLTEWWEEFRLYHRKNGQVVKERDDLISATRMAVMMLRFADREKGGEVLPQMANLGYAKMKERSRWGRGNLPPSSADKGGEN